MGEWTLAALKWGAIIALIGTGTLALLSLVTFVGMALVGLAGAQSVMTHQAYDPYQLLGVLNGGVWTLGSDSMGSVGYTLTSLALIIPAAWASFWLWKAVKYVLSA